MMRFHSNSNILNINSKLLGMNNNSSDEIPFKFTIPIPIFDSQQPQQNPEKENDQESQQAAEEETLEALIGRGGTVNEALLQLPLDVFIDILSRLSIKPLAVCRCVCKTWRTIVHHSRFIKMHHNKAIQSTQSHNHFSSYTSLLLTFRFIRHKYNLHFHRPDFVYFLEHETDDSFDNSVLVKPPLSPTDPQSICSCNGLLCTAPDFHNFNISNPVTGEYMVISPAYRDLGCFYSVYGFGFDQVANEYKIIVMYLRRICLPTGQETYKMAGEIYTLGSGEWRMLTDVPCTIHGQSPTAVFVNRALHWMGDDNDVVSSSEFIIAFDVGSEEFRIIPPPPGLIPRCHEGVFGLIPHKCNQRLGNLGGCLCVSDHSSRDWCDIWVMKGYGVNCSWTKEFVISQEDVGRFPILPVTPVSLMKSGSILMVLDDKILVSYDPATKSCSKIGMIDEGYRLAATSHIGSLLSFRDIIQPTDGRHEITTGRW